MRKLGSMTVFVALMLLQEAVGVVPRLTQLQGVLRDSSGAVVGDSTYSVTFRVYDAATAGSLLWTETRTVSTSMGLFNVMLGETTAIPPTLFDDTLRWLGVTIEPGAELTPRIRLGSGPYSFATEAWTRDNDTLYTSAVAIVIDGLRIPTGAGSGKVLTSDAVGNSSWQTVIPTSQPWVDAGTVVHLTNNDDSVGIGTTSPNGKTEIYAAGRQVGLRINGVVGDGVVRQRAVYATTGDVTGGSAAVEGIAEGPTGETWGLHGESESSHALAAGVRGDISGPGTGVLGVNTSNDNGSSGVHGRASAGLVPSGITYGVLGETNSPNGLAAGVRGVATDPAGNASGVYGLAGANPLGSPSEGGVVGESTNKRGVSGFSQESDGVEGRTEKVGTFSLGPGSIRAGVHGLSAPGLTADNFAVAGVADGYGTGVLGVGAGDEGHGVYGVAGIEDPASTNAGVRGTTREPAPGGPGWPPYYLPGDNSGKQNVGVLGQAYDRVGVWGESINRYGVVGTSGPQFSFSSLPVTTSGVYGRNVHPDAFGTSGVADSGTGVYGETRSLESDEAGVTGAVIDTLSKSSGVSGRTPSKSDSAMGVEGFASATSGETYGVFGETHSDDSAASGVAGLHGALANSGTGAGVRGRSKSKVEEAAGVRAVGAGVNGPGDPQAAALELENGAIRVTGDSRPAGTMYLGIPAWSPKSTCFFACPTCIHAHDYGWSAAVTLTNDLIEAGSAGVGSVILLTIESTGMSPYEYSANLETKSDGSAVVRIASLNTIPQCVPPRDELLLHYLIINH